MLKPDQDLQNLMFIYGEAQIEKIRDLMSQHNIFLNCCVP